MNADHKLEELFIDLPEPPAEIGKTLGAIRSGKLLIVSGALPFSEGRIQYPGRVGIEIKLDAARLAARFAAVLALAQARKALEGSLNKIRQVVELRGAVACGADFRDHEKVVDGASELFAQVFGPFGRHVRDVVGVTSLPRNACVQLSVTFETK